MKKCRIELNKSLDILNELKMSNEPKWRKIKAESEKSISVFQAKMSDFKQELLLKKIEQFKKPIKSRLKTLQIDSAFDYLR